MIWRSTALLVPKRNSTACSDTRGWTPGGQITLHLLLLFLLFISAWQLQLCLCPLCPITWGLCHQSLATIVAGRYLCQLGPVWLCKCLSTAGPLRLSFSPFREVKPVSCSAWLALRQGSRLILIDFILLPLQVQKWYSHSQMLLLQDLQEADSRTRCQLHV